MGWSDLIWSQPRSASASPPASSAERAPSAPTASTTPSDRTPWQSYLRHTSTLSGLPPTSPIVTTIIPSAVLTTALLSSTLLYRRHFGRIASTAQIPPAKIRGFKIRGYVTGVGDGDNFRIFHTPGGALLGWGWLPGRTRHLPLPPTRDTTQGNDRTSNNTAKDTDATSAASNASPAPPTRGPIHARTETLSLRIAGIDAPELAHFGNPAQPFGIEALNFLRAQVLHRSVTATLHRADQYGRVVGTVRGSPVPPRLVLRLSEGLSRRGVVLRVLFAPVLGLLRVLVWVGNVLRGRRTVDVGLEMIRAGLATVYEAKFGAEFGGDESEKVYRAAEARAKSEGKGIWGTEKSELERAQAGSKTSGRAEGRSALGWLGSWWAKDGKAEVRRESPREYKTRTRDLEEGKAPGGKK